MKITARIKTPTKLTAKFNELKIPLSGGFEEGYDQGYAAGYEVGNTEGYTQGFTDASPELWNNDSMAMADCWIKDNSGAYPYRNMGLTPGKYRFSVEENLAVNGKLPPDVTGVYCLYISKKKAGASGELFSNSGTTQHKMEYVFDVVEGDTWYFNIYPIGGQNVLFTRLLLGASLKRIGN